MKDPLAVPKRFVEDVKRRHGVRESEERCPACGGARWWHSVLKLPDGTDKEMKIGCLCFMPEKSSWSTPKTDKTTGKFLGYDTKTTCLLTCEKCGSRDQVSEAIWDAFSSGGWICPVCDPTSPLVAEPPKEQG